MDVQDHTDIPQQLRRILGDMKPGNPKVTVPRTIKRCFHVGNTFFAIASDDTAWYLRRMDKLTGPDFWEQLQDATTPALPQNETVVR